MPMVNAIAGGLSGAGGGGGGGGSDVTPNAVNWTDIVTTSTQADTNTQTISGIDTTISLSCTVSPGTAVTLSYSVDGAAFAPYGAPFDVTNNQTVQFRMNDPLGNLESGSVTIRNDSDSSAILDTFNYNFTT